MCGHLVRAAAVPASRTAREAVRGNGLACSGHVGHVHVFGEWHRERQPFARPCSRATRRSACASHARALSR
ncbi:MAG: hypothetical protein AVDCRST_MAG40-118 [uncultured Gemmatimonadaceae bacterium]|uniref:Uncharacterized protein n=1 Tax=uncultured Gemmatimonadaceae bacterium TaxID=246130 RepID=A0A6J4K621_9BACT|nr:MAG: hypothetical protein AVDCRST_MAG40-118 [uncultured Gemmatimonadaceae bacterium]